MKLRIELEINREYGHQELEDMEIIERADMIVNAMDKGFKAYHITMDEIEIHRVDEDVNTEDEE